MKLSAGYLERYSCKTCGIDPRKYTDGCPECAERKSREDNFSKRFDRIKQAREAIIKSSGGKKGISGRLDCPVCQTDKIAFAIQKNGHIQAICETEGCVQWIE
jgi:predicted ATP-dependent serine protease